MTTTTAVRERPRVGWFQEKILLGKSLSAYVASLFTPFNAVAAVIVLIGAVAAVIRYTQGLAAATNLSDVFPWGLWIGVDVMSGVALAAGGYTLATTVYIFRMKDYYPMVRPAILTGLLGYFFVAVGLLFDLGRPWRLPYPLGISMGMTSVMFSVGWHLFLYLIFLCIEFLPVAFEWLHWERPRSFVLRLTLWVTILGVMLSTLHQAALGGLFLLAPGKVHPLWYSPLLPLFFLASSAFAGLAMVIVECSLSHKCLSGLCDHTQAHKMPRLLSGLAKAASVLMMVYLGFKAMAFVHGEAWNYLGDAFGNWFLIETLGFVALPAVLFAWAAARQSVGLIRIAAVITVVGVLFNRVNISMIVYNWQLPERYFPAWSEFAITLAIITVGVLAFRWIANRMPVLRPHPEFGAEH